MKVVVLGAGLAGVTTGWQLLHDGHAVTVLDAQQQPAMATSFANGGQISVYEATPWTNFSTVWNIIKGVGHKPFAPFHLTLTRHPHQWRWLYRFLMQCGKTQTTEALQHNINLALFSVQQYHKTKIIPAQQTPNQGMPNQGMPNQGILHVYQNKKAFHKAQQHCALLADRGLDTKTVSPKDCHALEPLINPDKVAGGIYAPKDETGDARAFAEALAQQSIKKGVGYKLGTTVLGLQKKGRAITGVHTMKKVGTTITKDTLEADAIVVALGEKTQGFMRRYGVRLPVLPVAGYSATLEMAPKSPQKKIAGFTFIEHRLVASHLDTRLRIAGMADISSPRPFDTRRAQALLSKSFNLLHPINAKKCPPLFWRGVRAMTPDGMPIVGQTPKYANLYLNTGHGSLGWTLCHGTARLVADAIGGKESKINSAPYGLERFL